MAGKSALSLALLVTTALTGSLRAESSSFSVNYTLKYKTIENVEERQWPGSFAYLGNPAPTPEELKFDSLISTIHFLNLGYELERGYLEQRSYKSRVIEPGIGLKVNLDKFELSLDAGVMQNLSGSYRNNATIYCHNCTARTAEFDPSRLSFRDTAYTFQNGFNTNAPDEERYGEEGRLKLRGGVLNFELSYSPDRNQEFSPFIATGLYYTAVSSTITNFLSFTQYPWKSFLNRQIFYYPGDELIRRSYRVRQIPLKVGFVMKLSDIDFGASFSYLYGDGFFSTGNRAPGLPLFQSSKSHVRGDGWGFDFKLEKELSSELKLGVGFSGKRFFAKGKDYLHGSYYFLARAAQETFNLMDYARTPLVYQGLREQEFSLSLSRSY